MAEQELLAGSHIVRQTLSFYRESQQPVSVSISEVLDNVLELQVRNIQIQKSSSKNAISQTPPFRVSPANYARSL